MLADGVSVAGSRSVTFGAVREASVVSDTAATFSISNLSDSDKVAESVAAAGVRVALSRTETTGLVKTGAKLSCTDANPRGFMRWWSIIIVE